MSSLIGTSAEQPPAARRRQGVAFALTLTVLLAGMIGVLRFTAVDAGGFQRVRSAVQVWRTVPKGLERAGVASLLPVVFASALAVTVAGCFVLLWLAVAVK